MFKISVVIPVYNVEAYLTEAIESIVGQTIGFEKNIQLILVNDGSKDGSGAICSRCAEKYPQNVIYENRENEGVSAARNRGIDLAEGKYLTFLDGDDVWDKHAFKRMSHFFDEHYDEVDVVAARIRFFEGSEAYHPLDYKFRGDRMPTRIAYLDQEDEYDSVQSTAVTVFYKREAIGNLRFDARLKFGEDTTFVNRIILDKLAYGLVAEAEYGYRKRLDQSSAVNGQRQDISYYTDSLRYYHKVLQECSQRKYHRVVPYIQYINFHDLVYRLTREVDDVLTEEQKETFIRELKELFQNIDDFVFFKNRRAIRFTIRQAAYKLKHGHELMEDVHVDDENKALAIDGTEVLNFKNGNIMVRLCLIRKIGKVLRVEGMVSKALFEVPGEKTSLRFTVAGQAFPVDILGENRYHHYTTLFGDVYFANDFSVDIPLSVIDGRMEKIRCKIRYGKKAYIISFVAGKFLAGNRKSPNIFKKYGEYFVTLYNRRIEVRHPGKLSRRLKFKWMDHKHQKWLRRHGSRQIARFRSKYYWHCRFRFFRDKREIWLISDRVMNAGDNGEVFFKYLNRIKPGGIRPIFAISRDADCVPRLQSEGEVIFFEDPKYKQIFLDAKKIISSGASEFTLNPFDKDRKHLDDLFKYDFYYLQHGVACADLSDWLGRFKKNIHMIFTSGKKERNAFIRDRQYGYSADQVVLAGQARFDDLYDAKQKQILILPTWRKSIKESYDSNTTSVYFDGFKDTGYFQFYNSLINHPRLLEKMKEKGYRGTFCLHPIHKEQWVDFQGNNIFHVNEGYVNYNDEFASAALTVTDYSSVIFDFAYLRKAIVYAQFDREEFFKAQTYDEGYFSYEEDGFGPICSSLEETVDTLIRAIDDDCRVSPAYMERMNNFFAFDDKNNCKRIYEAIVKE